MITIRNEVLVILPYYYNGRRASRQLDSWPESGEEEWSGAGLTRPVQQGGCALSPADSFYDFLPDYKLIYAHSLTLTGPMLGINFQFGLDRKSFQTFRPEPTRKINLDSKNNSTELPDCPTQECNVIL